MSFSQGLSGLNAASKDLEVIGNNVANANTVGFKSSQAQFGDVFAAALSGAGSSQIGIGTKLLTVAQQFVQGNVTTTNNTLDMAINGPGFFQLKDTNGTQVLSRNGQFQLNNQSFIVNSSGHNLMGNLLDASGKPTKVNTPIQIPLTGGNPSATGSSPGIGAKGIVASFNLNSTSIPPTVSPFDPANPNSYTNSTSTTTYNSAGTAQTTTMFFVKDTVTSPIPNSITNGAGGVGAAVTYNLPLTTAPNGGAVQFLANLQVGQPVVGGNNFQPGTTVASLITTALPASAPGAIVNNAGATSATVTASAATIATLSVGQPISGAGFPAGTTITGINAVANTFTTSAGYTGTTVAGANTTAVTLSAITGFTASSNPSSIPAALTALSLDAPNQWQVYATVVDPTTGTALAPTTQLTSTASPLQYRPDGTFLGPLTLPSISFPAYQGLTESFTFDFSGSTQYGAAFGVTKLTQDGYAKGQLSGFSIGADGIIQGRYSNGITTPVAQIFLGNVPDMQGLQPMGNNEWAATAASGPVTLNPPGISGNGLIQTSATEGSNTDLTAELVNMITAQRTYQANAQTIKTQDSVLQTLINMR